jgi:hypothetical protein
VNTSDCIALSGEYYSSVMVTRETWNVCKCGQDGVGIRLARVYDSATTVCAKTFIT